MIPLGEILARVIWVLLFPLFLLELKFFICHSASCMQDFVPKSIIT